MPEAIEQEATCDPLPDLSQFRPWTLEESFANVGRRVLTPSGKKRLIGSVSKNRETGAMELGIYLVDKRFWIQIPSERIALWAFVDTGERCGISANQ